MTAFRPTVCLTAFAAVLCLRPPCLAAPADRREFAARMAKVKEGMTKAEVACLLGKPDDVRTADEFSEGIFATKAKSEVRGPEVWCYGTRGRRTFPSRGCVYWDQNGTAFMVRGGGPVPAGLAALKEGDVDRLLRLLDRTPTAEGSNYDPLTMIQAVNALQPLGEARALPIIEEYLRVAPRYTWASERMHLVLRVLFDVPRNPGFVPAPHLGDPSPKPPTDAKLIPRFPIVLVDDVPLLTVSGYAVSGELAGMERSIAWFRTHARLRAKSLRPTDHPLELLGKIKASRQWIFDEDRMSARSNTGKAMLMGQLMRLVKSVYRPGVNLGRYENRAGRGVDREWASVLAGFRKLHVRWDAERGDYVRLK